MMKIKLLIILLLLSTKIFAYSKQEIVQIIQQQKNNNSSQSSFAKKNNVPVLKWKPLNGPRINGGFNVVVMKHNQSSLFAYSPYAENISIYQSKDGGLNWKIINSPPIHQIHHLISLNDKSLLLAADNKIYLSKDQGKNWQLSAKVDKSCDKLFSPTRALILLTTNFNDQNPGLYRSIDGGKTFTPARLGIKENSPFAVMGGNENVWLIGTNDIYLSNNHGLLWQQNSLNWKDKLISALAINQQSDIFIAANNRLYKTDITGEKWVQLGLALGRIENVKVDANNRVYVIGHNEEASLYRSSDQGETWTLLHQSKQIIEFYILDNNKILINTDQGLIESDESQLNYTHLAEFPFSKATSNHVIALDENHYLATAYLYFGPLYASDDAGKTWQMIRESAVIDVVKFNKQIVVLEYNNTDQQIVVSPDFGKSWQDKFHIKENYCHSLSAQSSGLMINCQKESYATFDLVHWMSLKINKTNPSCTSYFNGKTIYIADGNSIQRSVDEGLTWQILLENLHQTHAYIDGYKDQLLIIAINHAGIIKMTNEGRDWDLINDGLTNFDFTHLLVIDSDHYLVSTNGGVFYTQNGGRNWISQNSGLNNLSIFSLSLYQHTLLAGTEGSGVFSAVFNLI